MQLVTVAIVSAFGRGKSNPLLTGLLRLFSLWGTAALLGIWFATMVPPLPISTPQSTAWLCSCLYIMQLTCVLALLSAYTIIQPHAQGSIARLLVYLPLHQTTRWLYILSPGMALLMVATLLTLPTCLVLLHDSIWHWLLWPSCLISAASALGWVYVPLSKSIFRALSIVAAVLIAQYYLLHILHDVSQDPAIQVLSLVCFLGLVILGIGLLIYGQHRICTDITMSRPTARLHMAILSTRWWMIKKLFRSPVTGTGFWITVGVSSLTALLVSHLHLTDINLTAGMLALLAAALASDARRSSKKIAPVEITGLKATGYFVVKEYSATALLCSLAVSPISFWVLWSIVRTPSLLPVSVHTTMLLVGANLLLGISAGLWSGIQFASQAKDISAQCSSIFAALAIIAAPQLPWLSQISVTPRICLQIGLAALLLIIGTAIEYRRNSFVWRK